MHSSSPFSTVQALFRVFVLPASLKSTTHRPATTKLPRKAVQRLQTHRAFSQSAPSCAKTRVAETRSQKWDHEIKARYIQLVDPNTGKLSEPTPTFGILSNLDTKTHRLIQLQPEPSDVDPRAFTPACKIISKKEHYESIQRQKTRAKEQKRIQAKTGEAAAKTLELNWAIDGNDLGHRLERMKEFLGEGRRVEIVLARKKAGRRATAEECEAVLKRIRSAVGEVEGASERSAMDGKMGGFARLLFQGRPLKMTAGEKRDGRQHDDED